MAVYISPRMAASRRNGAKGGQARAANHTKEDFTRWGERAGAATRDRYGREYYVYLRSQRKDSAIAADIVIVTGKRGKPTTGKRSGKNRN